MATITTNPAYLFVGAPDGVNAHVVSMLKQHFCATAQTDDCFCAQCRRITQRQHHSIVWISPEKDYTVDDVEPIFDRTRFTLDPGMHCFFILERAHTMNTATANRLLKVLEEPPMGYHFIVLTSNANDILPTIRSRCIETTLHSDSQSPHVGYHPLLGFFLNAHHSKSPFDFEAELKTQHLSDTQSVELAQLLLATLSQQWKEALQGGDAPVAQAVKIKLDFVVAALRRPPQSGSSDLFWKQFFVRFPW